MKYYNGMAFTTKDRDQDTSGGNCAYRRLGAWWHGNCSVYNLNGRYRPCWPTSLRCIFWWRWPNHGSRYTQPLKASRMSIRAQKESSTAAVLNKH